MESTESEPGSVALLIGVSLVGGLLGGVLAFVPAWGLGYVEAARPEVPGASPAPAAPGLPSPAAESEPVTTPVAPALPAAPSPEPTPPREEIEHEADEPDVSVRVPPLDEAPAEELQQKADARLLTYQGPGRAHFRRMKGRVSSPSAAWSVYDRAAVSRDLEAMVGMVGVIKSLGGREPTALDQRAEQWFRVWAVLDRPEGLAWLKAASVKSDLAALLIARLVKWGRLELEPNELAALLLAHAEAGNRHANYELALLAGLRSPQGLARLEKAADADHTIAINTLASQLARRDPGKGLRVALRGIRELKMDLHALVEINAQTVADGDVTSAETLQLAIEGVGLVVERERGRRDDPSGLCRALILRGRLHERSLDFDAARADYNACVLVGESAGGRVQPLEVKAARTLLARLDKEQQ